MNTQSEILARLLNLFPVQKIKDHWQNKGNKEDIIKTISETVNPEDIKHFAKINAGLTKQLIFVRKPVPFSKVTTSLIADAELVSNETRSGVVEHFYLLNLEYDVYLSAPVEVQKLKFFWPVRIMFEKAHFRVHITRMEKDVAAYFSDAREATPKGKNLDETQIIMKICNGLGGEIDSSPYDLNKGVKALWAGDIIDSPNAKWKEEKDTTTKTMDGEYLLKRDNPKAYAQMVKSPLLKTSFKLLKPSEDYPKHFLAVPTMGEISISTYSEHVSISENVIREILRLN